MSDAFISTSSAGGGGDYSQLDLRYPKFSITDALTTSVGTNSSNITSNDGDIATLQSDVSTLQTNVSSNDTDISNLQSSVSTLQTNVGTNDTDISNLQSSVSTLQTNVGTNDTDISNLQSSVSTAQTTANNALPLAGGTMAGNITMNGNSMSGGHINMYAGNATQSRTIDFGTYSITSVDHKVYESTDQVLHLGNSANSNEVQISETGITLNSANPISVPNGMNVDIPFLHMFRSVYQSIPNTSTTTVDWDTTILNRGGFTESAGVITVPEDGLYAFSTEVIWMPNATNTRHQWVECSNTTNYVAGKRFGYTVVNATGNSHATCVNLSGTFNLSAGNTIKVQLYQDSGSAINISKTLDEAQSMDMQLYKIGSKI